jgi:3-oxoacyl-[acyl-carrier-protein] synthase III
MNLHSYIESYGTFLPSSSESSLKTVCDITHRVWIPLQLATGIRQRRVTDWHSSLELAQQAVKKCLERSCFSSKDIDLVIGCNISKLDATGMQFDMEPSYALEICRFFNLQPQAAFDLNNACAGIFTGIYLANRLIEAGSIRRALIFSGEHISPLAHTAQQEIESVHDSRFACLTLGDAGVALILDGTQDSSIGFQHCELRTLPEYSRLCIAYPTPYEHGGMIMHTVSSEISSVGTNETAKALIAAIESGHVTMTSSSKVITHQIASALPRRVGRIVNAHFDTKLTRDGQFIDNIGYVGNTASTSHVVALAHAVSQEVICPQNEVVFVVAASGLTIGLFDYKMDDLPEKIAVFKAHGDGRKFPRVESLNQSTDTLRVYDGSMPHIAIAHIAMDFGGHDTTVKSASRIFNKCLQESHVPMDDVDYLIDCGQYHSNGVMEPSQASLIAGEVGLDSKLRKHPLLCFDTPNGGLGWLYGAYVAQFLLNKGSFDGQSRYGMLTAAEGGTKDHIGCFDKLNIGQCTSASLLKTSDGTAGFSHFHFRTYPHFSELRQIKLKCCGTTSHYDVHVNATYEERLLECLVETCQDWLRLNNLHIDDFRYVLLPQISPNFFIKASECLGVSLSQLVDVSGLTGGNDPFTSGVALALATCLRNPDWRQGERALMVASAGGMQVGMAVYTR